VDQNAFKQINLSTSDKVRIVVAWMEFICHMQSPVLRNKVTNSYFIAESNESVIIRLRSSDIWIEEHVARLFWTCVELGLLKYQYPYPHEEQSYSPTRFGKFVGKIPPWLAYTILRSFLVFEMVTDPIKNFKKIRNTVVTLTAFIGWINDPQIQATTLLIISILAAIVSTWVANILTSVD